MAKYLRNVWIICWIWSFKERKISWSLSVTVFLLKISSQLHSQFSARRAGWQLVHITGHPEDLGVVKVHHCTILIHDKSMSMHRFYDSLFASVQKTLLEVFLISVGFALKWWPWFLVSLHVAIALSPPYIDNYRLASHNPSSLSGITVSVLKSLGLLADILSTSLFI